MFYDRFKEICRAHGETPTGVGLKLGISKGTVAGWKKGSNPSVATAQKIADYFGVTTDYLLTGTKKEPPEGDPENPRQSMHDRIDNMTDEEYQRFVEILKLVSPDRFKEK